MFNRVCVRACDIELISTDRVQDIMKQVRRTLQLTDIYTEAERREFLKISVISVVRRYYSHQLYDEKETEPVKGK